LVEEPLQVRKPLDVFEFLRHGAMHPGACPLGATAGRWAIGR
jgi:hypothetical protein